MAVLQRARLFLELVRFSHTIFALPFALMSAVLAWQIPGSEFRWLDLLGIVLCMVFARSAAMAFNRLVDQRLDANNPRTAGRHLPAGLMSRTSVWWFLAICAFGFCASTLLFLRHDPPNIWPLVLSVPVLLFIAAYSLTKRFTALAHFWLGASLMLAPIAAWIAIRGLDRMVPPTVLGLAVLFWVAGFDMLYACQDVDVDRRLRLHSIPARFGLNSALRLAMICHVVTAALLMLLYYVASPPLGGVYLVGVTAVIVLLAYEHSLVRPDDLSRVNRAFFQVNGVISIGLFLLVLLQVIVKW